METGLKKELSYRVIMIFTLFFLCITPHINGSQTPVSFDTLFLMTWYEKGMRSLLFVWHELKSPQMCSQLCVDICLSKLTFARCCIERIAKEGERLLQEDRDYCRMVLDKVRVLILRQTSDNGGVIDADHLYCFDNLIETINSAIGQPSTTIP